VIVERHLDRTGLDDDMASRPAQGLHSLSGGRHDLGDDRTQISSRHTFLL